MKLRAVKKDDFEFLYKLHTHPEIKKFSLSKQHYDYHQHRHWWDKQLKEPNFQARIITYRKKRAGCIRRHEEYISIALMPEYQGKGLGTEALKVFCVKGDRARIKHTNFGSMFLFYKLGFKEEFTVCKK